MRWSRTRINRVVAIALLVAGLLHCLLNGVLCSFDEALAPGERYYYFAKDWACRPPSIPINTPPEAVGIVMIIAAAWIFVGRWLPILMRRLFRPRSLGLCATCGYNLTGVTLDRCPECGVLKDLVA